MTARRAPRSQHGPKAEARRRVVERMGEAEGLLGAYIAAGEEIADLAAQVKAAEADQAQALAQLAALVGRPMAPVWPRSMTAECVRLWPGSQRVTDATQLRRMARTEAAMTPMSR